MRIRSVFVAFAAAILTACAGNAMHGPTPLLPDVAGPPAFDTGALTIRVRMPLHPDVVSPSTKGMTVKIVGPTKFHKTVGLVLNAKGCKSSLMTLECTLVIPKLKKCPTKKHCYTASVATYDAFDAVHKKIPPGAHILSQEQGLTFAIRSATTLIPLVLQGLPATIAFIPAANTILTGSQDAGYVEPKCSASSQTVTALGVDADGNYILGPGAPAISFASDDPAQLSSVKLSSNAFALNPPAAPGYAFGNHTTHFTVSAKPGSKSGGTTRTAVVAITYSGEICGIINEFLIPTAASDPASIARGPDGNLWFTEFAGDRIGRITLQGTISEFAIPAGGGSPFGITTGPNGDLWFTEFLSSKIGELNPATGTFVQIPTPTAGSEPYLITTGPDGNVWFTEAGVGKIGKMSPATNAITEFPLASATSAPTTIVSGPNGNLWFSETGSGVIGTITPAGAVTPFSIPSGGSSAPSGIAVGDDGNLWFAECSRNFIGTISPTGVVFAQYPLPEAASGPTFAATGPDGRVWFSEEPGNRIGAISESGTFTEFASPTSASNPVGIVTGPDGALWFTELAGNKIARLR
jgi:streptogramin lyase